MLTDSRDIYEATANFGARRMRACILGVIPGDVVDMAVNECKETQKKAMENFRARRKSIRLKNCLKKILELQKNRLKNMQDETWEILVLTSVLTYGEYTQL